MASIAVVPGGPNIETVDARQRRPVHRHNFRSPPGRVGVDAGRGSNHSRQVESTYEPDHPRESLLVPLPPPETRS